MGWGGGIKRLYIVLTFCYYYKELLIFKFNLHIHEMFQSGKY